MTVKDFLNKSINSKYDFIIIVQRADVVIGGSYKFKSIKGSKFYKSMIEIPAEILNGELLLWNFVGRHCHDINGEVSDDNVMYLYIK